jgi:hypothetical protein
MHMSAMRVIIAAIVGGIVVFAWNAVAHMVLPLGEMGIQSLPAEEAVVPALQQAIRQRGLYFFPGMPPGEMTSEATKGGEEKMRRGPQGILVYDPAGGEMMDPAQLGIELGSTVLGALLVAVVLACTRVGRAGRTLLATALGLFAWASIEVSYWNWYRFPDAYALGTLIEHTVGWLLGGVAIALALGRPKPAQPSRT